MNESIPNARLAADLAAWIAECLDDNGDRFHDSVICAGITTLAAIDADLAHRIRNDATTLYPDIFPNPAN